MSGAEGKADVQVTRLGHVFPFGGSSGSPLPHLTQCCRFSIPERLPLRPFRQDRLPRLPLPPSLMAASCKTVPSTGAGIALPRSQYVLADPLKKIMQLEKNILFIQEGHVQMLRSLHEEISDLKQKNRELHFQLVTGYPALPPESSDSKSEESDKIEKLDKEIRKLRASLKEALKNNTMLTDELQSLKSERASVPSSNAAGTNHPRMSKDHGPTSRGGRTPRSGPSPEMDDYGDTLRQIQRAAGNRNSKSSDAHHSDQSNHYWGGKGGSGYLENRRSNNYHHHMMQHDARQRHHHHHQQQPRLPRLPLRNQLQNYMPHNQYEIQYQQHRTSNILPSLKQSEQHRQNKPRKPRGPQQAKVADQVYNQ